MGSSGKFWQGELGLEFWNLRDFSDHLISPLHGPDEKKTHNRILERMLTHPGVVWHAHTHADGKQRASFSLVARKDTYSGVEGWRAIRKSEWVSTICGRLLGW